MEMWKRIWGKPKTLTPQVEPDITHPTAQLAILTPLIHTDNYPVELQFGHTMEGKPEDTFRIYLYSFNGIKIEKQKPTKYFKNLQQDRLDHSLDIFDWAETKVEWGDYHTNNTLYKTFKQKFTAGK